MLALQTAELTLMCKTFVMQCANDTSSVFSYPVQGVVLSAELWHRLRWQVHRHWVWRQESNTLWSDFLSPSASSPCHQLARSAAPKLGNPSVCVATTLLSAHWILLKVHTPLVSAAFLVDYSGQSSYALCTPYYTTWSSHHVNTERDVFHFILDQNSASGLTRWWWELSVAESDGEFRINFM